VVTITDDKAAYRTYAKVEPTLEQAKALQTRVENRLAETTKEYGEQIPVPLFARKLVHRVCAVVTSATAAAPPGSRTAHPGNRRR
jgi:hypothetical protein